MDERLVEAAAAHLHVLDPRAPALRPLEQSGQLGADVPDPRPEGAGILAALEARDRPGGRAVEADHDLALAADGALDQLGQGSDRDQTAVIDDGDPIAAALGLLEMMRGD